MMIMERRVRADSVHSCGGEEIILSPRISKLIVFSLFFCNSKRQGVKKKKKLGQASLLETVYKKETKICVNIRQ